MNKIVYRVYSDVGNESAATDSTPVAPIAESVSQALKQFPLDVEALLDEFEASVTCESPTKESNAIVAVIESTASEEQVGAAVATCLSKLDLQGSRLQRV